MQAGGPAACKKGTFHNFYSLFPRCFSEFGRTSRKTKFPKSIWKTPLKAGKYLSLGWAAWLKKVFCLFMDCVNYSFWEFVNNAFHFSIRRGYRSCIYL